MQKGLLHLMFYPKGRVVAGLGIGWSRDEYQVSNMPFNYRGKRADEFIQVLKKIWVDDVVEFKGDYYNFPASIIEAPINNFEFSTPNSLNTFGLIWLIGCKQTSVKTLIRSDSILLFAATNFEAEWTVGWDPLSQSPAKVNLNCFLKLSWRRSKLFLSAYDKDSAYEKD